MAKEYKTLVFPDTMQGRKQMAVEIDRLSAEGWEVKSKEVTQQGWSATKTCLLGCLFLPLALLGRKDNVITVIMERERTQLQQMIVAGEQCCVKDQCFTYSDYGEQTGFNTMAINGGPIREGLPVRVTFVGNTIVKLEVASSTK